jgi:hypothetical protein
MVDGVNIAQMLKDVNAIKQGKQTTRLNELKIGQAEAGIGKQQDIAALLPQAYGGDPAALTKVAALDPETGSAIQKFMQTASDNERKDVEFRTDLTGKLALSVMQSQNKPEAYQQALGILQQNKVDTSGFPQQYTPELDPQLEAFVAQASEIKNMVGGGSEFGQLTKDLSPEDKRAAIRQKLFLEPKPTSGKLVNRGGLLGTIDPQTSVFTPAIGPDDKPITAGDIGKAGATVKTLETTATKEAEAEVRKKYAAPEAYNTMQFGLRAVEDIKKKVQGLKSHPGREAATGGSSIIPSRPGGEAAGFEANLLALQAETALASLIEAKANGATFGALSDAELDLLKAKLASLDLRQPEGQFIDNLNEITAMMDRKAADIEAAFKNQYGDYKPESPAQSQGSIQQIQNDDDYNALPSGTQFIDPNGQTRTKP